MILRRAIVSAYLYGTCPSTAYVVDMYAVRGSSLSGQPYRSRLAIALKELSRPDTRAPLSKSLRVEVAPCRELSQMIETFHNAPNSSFEPAGIAFRFDRHHPVLEWLGGLVESESSELFSPGENIDFALTFAFGESVIPPPLMGSPMEERNYRRSCIASGLCYLQMYNRGSIDRKSLMAHLSSARPIPEMKRRRQD
jgi:hypothetical protein